MDDQLHLVSILGNALGTGAPIAVLLLILWRVLSKIAERLIAALDNLGAAVREHTVRDLASHSELGQHVSSGHAEVREAIIRVETKLDADRDWRNRLDHH